jgi:hypothetical protein
MIALPERPQPEQRDLAVPVTKAAAMRYIAEAVGHGHSLYQAGELPATKAQAFVEKMDLQYGVLATRGARDYARQKGRSCARLIMYPADDLGETWLFWLLASPGDGPLPGQGNTLDARIPQTRLTWGSQYELVGRPVRRRQSGELHHVWTWAMTDTTYRKWSERLRKAAGRVRSSVERKPDYLLQQLELLRKVPGFHAINRQKRELIRAADIPREWQEHLELGYLGTVVDKKLQMFAAGRTVRSLTTDSSGGEGHPVGDIGE